MQRTSKIQRYVPNDGYFPPHTDLPRSHYNLIQGCCIARYCYPEQYLAEGSANTMFSGIRAYKCAIRVNKIIYEAFSRILQKDFEDAYPDAASTMRQYLKDVAEDFDLNFMSESDEMPQYCNDLVTFKEKLCTTSNVAKFWIRVLDMTELLFNLVYATRSGNRYLYIESVRSAPPRFFANDIGN